MKTIEKNLQEIGLAILLFILVATVMYCALDDGLTEDEIQLQEMINYHHSQGRDIIVNE